MTALADFTPAELSQIETLLPSFKIERATRFAYASAYADFGPDRVRLEKAGEGDFRVWFNGNRFSPPTFEKALEIAILSQ